jgi:acetate kinase
VVYASGQPDCVKDAAQRRFRRVRGGRFARQGIAAAAACLDHLDTLVLTGEIGADQPEVREAICAGLGIIGLTGDLDPVVNVDAVVSKPGAAIPVLALTVAEDLQVAEEARRVIARPAS